jgi:hypothetical protein
MGYKKLSDEQEKQLVQEYISGIPVKDLMIKYQHLFIINFFPCFFI